MWDITKIINLLNHIVNLIYYYVVIRIYKFEINNYGVIWSIDCILVCEKFSDTVVKVLCVCENFVRLLSCCGNYC